MSNTPGVYFDIGKKARDLLYQDYARQPPIRFNYQRLNWSTDISCEVEELVPGLSTLFSFIIPSSGKVELQYKNGFSGVAGGIELIPNPFSGYDPIANFSGVIGSTLFSLGTDLVFDISTRAFNKFNAGLSFNSDFVIASLSLDKLDTLKASCHCMVNPMTNTAIAAELKHSFSVNDTALTIGAQHALFPSTLAKGRVSTHGQVGALIQQGLWQKIFLSISGEVDFTGINTSYKTTKIGLSLALRL